MSAIIDYCHRRCRLWLPMSGIGYYMLYAIAYGISPMSVIIANDISNVGARLLSIVADADVG
jgi:hypothetical protein